MINKGVPKAAPAPDDIGAAAKDGTRLQGICG
jgi:hypothetical protein